MPAVSAEHMAWLKDQCNELVLGRCRTSNCMERGGYRPGMSREERLAVKATCIPLEIYRDLARDRDAT